MLWYPEGMNLREKKLFCQVVAQLLIIDGQLTDGEHKFLYALMESHGLSQVQQEDVVSGVNLDSSVEARVEALPVGERNALVAELKAAAGADGEVTFDEQAIIDLVVGAEA